MRQLSQEKSGLSNRDPCFMIYTNATDKKNDERNFYVDAGKTGFSVRAPRVISMCKNDELRR